MSSADVKSAFETHGSWFLMTLTVRILMVGLGNLGRRFCDLLAEKGPHLEGRYGLRLLLVGAADSRGVAYDPSGLDPARLSAIKVAGGSAGGRDVSSATSHTWPSGRNGLQELSGVHPAGSPPP